MGSEGAAAILKKTACGGTDCGVDRIWQSPLTSSGNNQNININKNNIKEEEEEEDNDINNKNYTNKNKNKVAITNHWVVLALDDDVAEQTRLLRVSRCEELVVQLAPPLSNFMRGGALELLPDLALHFVEHFLMPVAAERLLLAQAVLVVKLAVVLDQRDEVLLLHHQLVVHPREAVLLLALLMLPPHLQPALDEALLLLVFHAQLGARRLPILRVPPLLGRVHMRVGRRAVHHWCAASAVQLGLRLLQRLSGQAKSEGRGPLRRTKRVVHQQLP
mmetsp:Transcript_12815/g.30135  ORF Transcript_12815/g.30135 Transcript_12815/m.30135 type:complete len:275 (+) Transcript_12815:294-1118(+)